MFKVSLLAAAAAMALGPALAPNSADARSKLARWLLEPVIAGAVSGYIATKVAQADQVSNQAAPRGWVRGEVFVAEGAFSAWNRDGNAYRYGPGRYEVEMAGSRDGYDYIIFEDRYAERLLLVVLY